MRGSVRAHVPKANNITNSCVRCWHLTVTTVHFETPSVFFSEEQIGSEFLGPNKLDVESAGVRRTSQRCRAIDPCEYLLHGVGRLAHSAVAAGTFTLNMMPTAIAANAQNPIATATKNPIAPRSSQ